MNPTYLAADFGGGSGRVIAGSLRPEGKGYCLELKEIHRFANRPVQMGDYFVWDFPSLYADMLEGFAKAARQGLDVVSVGIDTWGVDFGLIDSTGQLAGMPMCYRDTHTDGMPEIFAREESPQAHYAEAGIQVLPINTLYRLMAMKRADDPRLDIARRLLFTPDLLTYFLTGHEINEYTIASTSEMLDARTRSWNEPLLRRMGLRPEMMCPITMPGTVVGNITPRVAEATGLDSNVKVVAVGSHDTASAAFASPRNYTTDRAAFLSSGTWSLLGVELDEPVLTEEARRAGFSNEGGVGAKTLLLQNITGLWILQRLAAQWRERGEDPGWPALIDEAEAAADTAVIDVDDQRFSRPDAMEQTIAAYCRETSQPSPSTRGEYVRCVCRSLAERYRKAVEQVNTLLPRPLEALQIIGGGSNNRLLNAMTAEATGLKVFAGPAEATAIGNILLQAITARQISSKEQVTDIRQL